MVSWSISCASGRASTSKQNGAFGYRYAKILCYERILANVNPLCKCLAAAMKLQLRHIVERKSIVMIQYQM